MCHIELNNGVIILHQLIDFSNALWKMNGEVEEGKTLDLLICVYIIMPIEYFNNSVMLLNE